MGFDHECGWCGERLVIDCVSWSIIKDTTPLNLFGYGLAFLGAAYYNHSKLQAFKVKEVQKKASQADEEQITNPDSVSKKKKSQTQIN